MKSVRGLALWALLIMTLCVTGCRVTAGVTPTWNENRGPAMRLPGDEELNYRR